MDHNAGQYKKIRIQSIEKVAKEFKLIVFEEGHGIQYKAGQYLTLLFELNQQEFRRSYSIVSSPAWKEPLAIGVKRIANGSFSRALTDRVRVGDELLTIGSGGLFTLPDEITEFQQLFFFAAGSGITPVYSLIKTALQWYPHLAVVLVYSNSSPETAAFLEKLKELSEKFPGRFHLELLFSNSPDLFRARLHRDLITEFLDNFLVTESSKSLFYICGPESYMRLCTYTLQENGVRPSHIKKENFIVHSVPRIKPDPPDKKAHFVKLHTTGIVNEVEVHYPDSILQAFRKKGIVLPYSCETGRCGNCVARCLSGNVWHSYNEVLTEQDLRKGLVLTCVGHPVGGDVELEM